MRAIQFEQFGGSGVLSLVASVPVPVPEADEVLIRVRAAGVNPVDWKIREGLLQGRLPHAFPIIPGWDAAGVVEAVGPDVRDPGLQPGEPVFTYCRKPVIQHGCYAEYVAMTAEHVVPMPGVLTPIEASTVPLAGLTAYQCLVDAAQVRAGQTVLVHAGAGGVGGFAVQIARKLGAVVFATASARNHAFVRSLGAEVVIDYTREDVPAAVHKHAPGGVDVVLDAVGGDTQKLSAACVREGGVGVSILALEHEQAFQDRGAALRYVFVAPNGAQLRTMGAWLADGSLTTHVQQVFPLDRAGEAQDAVRSGHTRGKLAIRVAEDADG